MPTKDKSVVLNIRLWNSKQKKYKYVADYIPVGFEDSVYGFWYGVARMHHKNAHGIGGRTDNMEISVNGGVWKKQKV